MHLAELLASALPESARSDTARSGALGSAYGVAPGARPAPSGRPAKALALAGTGLTGLAGLAAVGTAARLFRNRLTR